MTRYQELINQLAIDNPDQAEYLKEEIDIIIHKLKFLDKTNFPKTLIVSQVTGFSPVYSDLLEEKINIAGGQLVADFSQGVDTILVLQDNEKLYNDLPQWLQADQVTSLQAIKQDKVYIVHQSSFNQNDESYLKDLEILAEILQSKYFFYGRDGQDWVKFSIA